MVGNSMAPSTGAVANEAVGQPQNQTEQSGAINDAGTNPAGASAAGEQGANTEGNVNSQTGTLDELMEKNPEFKKQFDEKINGILGKKNAQNRAKMKPVNDIIDKMMVFHGVKSVEELSKKLDETLPEEFAAMKGVSGDLGKEMLDMRVKAAQDERARMYYNERMAAEKQYREWTEDAKAVKEIYPGFDLDTELASEQFRKLLNVNGLPMKQAYEIMHHDELIAAAEKRAGEAYAKSVNANLSRPMENGAGNQNAVSGKQDVSKLTKKERAELIKRSMRGETITFR